ncbi:MAG: hypothetical protein NTW80_08605, partial [Deltaproteobacteria bacterium]|nr:hypothetical protein [Deltaproteobacteria bacterium]
NLEMKGSLSVVGVGSISGTTNRSLSTAPSVLGGLKLGTWFVPTGTLGYSYPDWMKYFGFYTDFSYQRLDARRQVVARLPAGFVGNIEIESEGSVATWDFMFAARYGFLQDSEVPFGRLQPYVAVGPAVMFSSRDAKLSAPGINMANNVNVLSGWGLGNTGSTNIALAAEAGIRYMCLKNVSVDISFKYRYANPSFNYNNISGSGVSLDLQPTYNLFSGQVGVAYHF